MSHDDAPANGLATLEPQEQQDSLEVRGDHGKDSAAQIYRKKKSNKAKAELNKKEDDTSIPSELLVPKYQAGERASEAAKLKSLQAMEQVPLDRLAKLQGIPSRNIKDGGNEVNDARLLELVGDKVNRAADYGVSAMHIKTTKRMNKRVYQDEVIDRIPQFVRCQLQNTSDPGYDPVHKKKSKNKDCKIRNIYNKRTEQASR